MRKLSDDDKTVNEFKNDYFDYGVHKVLLGEFENGGTGDGEKEYIEITVMDPEDGEITDTARVWFTTDKAANYSFNVLRQIYVHNTPEAKKDQARDEFDKLLNTDEIVALMNEKLIGKEAWFSKYPSPTRTYVDKDGNTRKSIDKNVAGYPLKEKPELLPQSLRGDDTVVDDLGGEEATGDAAANVPKGW